MLIDNHYLPWLSIYHNLHSWFFISDYCPLLSSIFHLVFPSLFIYHNQFPTMSIYLPNPWDWLSHPITSNSGPEDSLWYKTHQSDWNHRPLPHRCMHWILSKVLRPWTYGDFISSELTSQLFGHPQESLIILYWLLCNFETFLLCLSGTSS